MADPTSTTTATGRRHRNDRCKPTALRSNNSHRQPHPLTPNSHVHLLSQTSRCHSQHRPRHTPHTVGVRLMQRQDHRSRRVPLRRTARSLPQPATRTERHHTGRCHTADKGRTRIRLRQMSGNAEKDCASIVCLFLYFNR